MSKGGDWVPIDKEAVKTLGNLGRPYSTVEALLSHTVDVDCDNAWTINGYAKLWGWSRGKVRRFVNSLRTQSGHLANTKGTQSGHPVHFIDKALWGEANTKGTQSGHKADSRRDTTLNPNPKPNPNKEKKTYGHFANVLLSEKEFLALQERFNSKTNDKIETLSEYLKSKGKKYKSHYATILAWDRRDNKGKVESKWQ